MQQLSNKIWGHVYPLKIKKRFLVYKNYIFPNYDKMILESNHLFNYANQQDFKKTYIRIFSTIAWNTKICIELSSKFQRLNWVFSFKILTVAVEYCSSSYSLS